ncbi:hypothetical protein [Mycolicibacterium arseniciresistens]|uniref:Lipoprotein LpqE n=1 Tax=Mycolicibacterium arseniciresistens TaxID=3062257 RepID=A0ABT8UB39_9MYCO|nr:hypothetical protein [Mycolicibacterium arseniciresistens]MDO3634999.1 hypothetical protein [Mycolicibacterium arseniciresistens]
MKSRILLTVPVAAVVLALTACGSNPSQSPSSTAAASSSESAAPATSSTSAVAGTVIEVTIAGGVVTPVNAQAEAALGEPIVLEVSSDVVDSFHVHSVPERTFDVEARPDQRFEFTIDVPGRVDVELHELHRTVVTIEVRP